MMRKCFLEYQMERRLETCIDIFQEEIKLPLKEISFYDTRGDYGPIQHLQRENDGGNEVTALDVIFNTSCDDIAKLCESIIVDYSAEVSRRRSLKEDEEVNDDSISLHELAIHFCLVVGMTINQALRAASAPSLIPFLKSRDEFHLSESEDRCFLRSLMKCACGKKDEVQDLKEGRSSGEEESDGFCASYSKKRFSEQSTTVPRSIRDSAYDTVMDEGGRSRYTEISEWGPRHTEVSGPRYTEISVAGPWYETTTGPRDSSYFQLSPRRSPSNQMSRVTVVSDVSARKVSFISDSIEAKSSLARSTYGSRKSSSVALSFQTPKLQHGRESSRLSLRASRLRKISGSSYGSQNRFSLQTLTSAFSSQGDDFETLAIETVEQLLRNMGINVDRVQRTDSVKKGTAIYGNDDEYAQIVVYVNGCPRGKQHNWIPRLLSMLLTILRENHETLEDSGIEVLELERHENFIRMNGVQVTLDIYLSSALTINDVIIAMREVTTEQLVYYESAIISAQTNYISKLPKVAKRCIRFLKEWRKQQVWASELHEPTDALFEMIVAFIVQEVAEKSTFNCIKCFSLIKRTFHMLERFDDIQITMVGVFFTEDDVPEQFLHGKTSPLILGVANPYINLADLSLFDYSQVASLAKQTHFMSKN